MLKNFYFKKNKALELEKEVKYILNQMYLQQVQFKFDFQINDFNDNGIDNVKIVISTNSGQPLQPLQKLLRVENYHVLC